MEIENQVSVFLATCYCMSFELESNRSVVGSCLHGCYEEFYHPVPRNEANLSTMCNHMKRTGLMCGQCEDRYGHPVYSYSLECVECSAYSYNWLKYIGAAFLPLTVFYVIVLVFRVSATSPALNSYILVSQVITVPIASEMIHHFTSSHSETQYQHLLQLFSVLVSSFYGIWNLDFFRVAYKPFCLHPALNRIHVISLDYLIAIYPLVLILITYVSILLHDRYPILARAWRPFYSFFVRFRREWNIQSSLVNVFATFFLLSYVKLLNVSYAILLYINLYNSDGEIMNKKTTFIDASVLYFGPDHLPFALLAIVVLCVFNILPIVLLFLYPCRWFQNYLSYFKIKSQALHTFMDAVQGCYKIEPRDYRQFAVVYLLFRNCLFAVFVCTTSIFYFTWMALLLFVVSIVVGLVQPYRRRKYNYIDSINILSVALSYACIEGYSHSKALQSHFLSAFLVVGALSITFPALYFCTIVLIKLGRFLPVKIKDKAKRAFRKCTRLQRSASEGFEESLPYRLLEKERSDD